MPIIAMAAHALAAEKEKCLASGMNDHVPKPIDPAILFAALIKWIRPIDPDDRASVPEPNSSDPDPVVLDPEAELPDFDTVAGLARVAQNQRLYLDLLFSFAEKHADAGARITDHLQQEKPKITADLAHTIKGMAGNLAPPKFRLPPTF